MWESIFFRYTAALLALVGSGVGIFIFLIHDTLMINSPELSQFISCILLGIIPAFAGFICGRLIQSLHDHAHRDQLTNLWNSRYFYSKLKKEIANLKRTKASLCVAFIDIDDFKVINDTYGHVAGDNALRSIATVLVGNTRESDTVVRWGGDEFVIIFPDTDLECASLFAERLRGMIESNSNCCQATISVGVLLVKHDVEVSQLLKMVDETLYTAKKTKNLVVLNTYS